MKSKFIVLFLPLLVCACAYQPSQYDSALILPKSFNQSDEVTVVGEAQKSWWKSFNAQELVSLMAEMHANNHDISIASYRIDKSLALMGVQKSANWPQVNASAELAQLKDHASGEATDTETVSLQASYDLDLWGRRDAMNRSFEYRVALQQQQLNSVSLTLQALLSVKYFDALALKERVKLTRQNRNTTEALYNKIKVKYDLGQSSSIELNQQKNVLLEQEKRLRLLERDYVLAKRSIAVLLGREDINQLQLNGSINDIEIPKVAITQPADLLETRPDIRMAELSLRISDAALFAAKAKRWPSFSLSAEISLNEVFGNADVATSLLGSLAAPVFQSGRINNEISAAAIDTDIQLANYRKVVVAAMQETMDSLTSYEFQQRIYAIQAQSVLNNDTLYGQTQLQYEAGSIDFLNLLAAQRSLFDDKDMLVQQKVIYLTNAVTIFKAMGNSPRTTEKDSIVTSTAN